MTLPARTAAAMLLRSFAVQGSWNYRTLIGTGFAFALLPALRLIYNGRPEALQAAIARHAAIFNCHPYLAPMALGAVAVLEPIEDPVVIERFKAAVRGALGGLGDRLIWAGWRPVCILSSIVLLLAGVRWPYAIGFFLVVYNAGHIAVRVIALQFGLRYGKQVGERLRGAPVERLQLLLHNSGAFLIGALLPLVAAGGPAEQRLPLLGSVIAVGIALAGVRYGPLIRLPMVVALTALALVGLALGVAA